MNGGLNNRQFVIVVLIIIVCGIAILGYDYYMAKRAGVYEDMSILLSQQPELLEEEPEEDEIVSSDNDPSGKVPKKNIVYNYDGRLKIEKMGLNKGFIKYGKSGNNVDQNVAVMKGSTYPDELYSHLILAAHNGVRWNAFFAGIEVLKVGDIASITYDGHKYNYKLVKIYKDKKNDGSINLYRHSDKKHLTLVTCSKPDYLKYFLVLTFELVSEERI